MMTDKTPATLQEIGAADAECAAAIATALHMYLNDSVHDAESFVLTIRRHDSDWTNRSLTFRKRPR